MEDLFYSDELVNLYEKYNIDTSSSGCWIAPVGKPGIHYATARNKDGDWLGFHRIAFYLSRGLEPEDISDLQIRHLCHNPSCVNPDHLEAGDACDNAQDTIFSGRKYGTGAGIAEVISAFEYYLEDRNYEIVAYRLGRSPETIKRWIAGKTHISGVVRKELEDLL